MELDELLPKLRELDRADKWRTVQVLMAELAQEEGMPFVPGAVYPVWSPYDFISGCHVRGAYRRRPVL